MSTLEARFRTMPDELLLKAIASRHKYTPEAISVALSEAAARGLDIPSDDSGDTPEPPPKSFWVSQVKKVLSADQSRKMNEDVLDWVPPAEESGNQARQLILLAIAGVLIITTLELISAWGEFQHFFLSVSFTLMVIAFALVVPVIATVGLWKKNKFGFYATGGIVVVSMLMGVLQIVAYFEPIFTYTDNNIQAFHLTALLPNVLYFLIALGIGWILTRRIVYQAFGFEKKTMRLAFVWGTLGLVGLNVLNSLAYAYL